MLTYDPITNPTKPKITMATSFQRTQLNRPNLSGQNVIISIIGGKINANAELLNAPTKEITAPKFGIAIANANVRNTKPVRSAYSPKCFDFSVCKCFCTAGQSMFIGT